MYYLRYLLRYPELELQHVLKAHPGTCICIEFDPTGRYFATGSADTLVSLWDVEELACIRTFSRYILICCLVGVNSLSSTNRNFYIFFRLDWPVRTISFSYDGKLLASASEDLIIDVGEVETGLKVSNFKFPN